eukprot:scaffold13311_cov161-Cylindrotheca_fusiformis.AAC.10
MNHSPLEWAQWCGSLGTFHLSSAVEWYDLELAINALEQSLFLIQSQTNDNSFLIRHWAEFMASVETNLGEAYFLDPQMEHFPQSLHHYEKAKHIYENLLTGEADLYLLDRANLQLAYARINSKVGAALLQMHTPIDVFSARNGMAGGNNLDITVGYPEHHGYVKQAQAAFSVAIETYQSQCATLSIKDDPDTFVQTCGEYASTLQYAATAESALGNLEKSEGHMMQATRVYFDGEDILVGSGNVDGALNNAYNDWHASGAVQSIANVLVNLSTIHAQRGDYGKSKRAYGLAMKFYSRFDIPVPPIAATVGGSEGLELESVLDQYFDMLTSYRRGTGQNGMQYEQGRKGPINYREQDQSQTQYTMYQRDDAYEGDILFNLGTIYLSMQDENEAIGWFEQAIELYTNKGDERKAQIASANANLSLLYMRQRRFEDSQRAHFDSLDMYQALYGDGVNPYVQGLEEYQEELVRVLETVGVKGSESKDGLSSDGGIAGSSIDLEKYQQSIRNATEAASAAAENDLKDEL